MELQIATTAPSFCEATALRFVLGCPREPHPFNPIEVQKDAVRLTRFYGRNGFPRASVDYDVVLDAEQNEVDVTFEICEGPQRILQEVQFRKPGAPPVSEDLAPELRGPWAEFVEDIGLEEGQRVSEASLIDLQNRTRQWLRIRGYAFADV
ncbi:MAG: POTRA domain-containing protein, partial [Bacteroidota bacterium]